jgi:phage-related protein
MPLLYANYPDLDNNLLNAAKKKIFSSAITQYTNLTDIKSNVQPTQSQMNEFFLKITTVIKQMNQQLRAVINGADPNKVAQDFGPIITEFANEFDNKIYPVYNYFSPQQNELIRNDLLKFELLVEEILYGNFGQVIDNFIETTPEQLSNLGLAVQSYSPLKITLRKGRQLLPIEELEGGYISGGSRNKGQKYPEIRFL